MGLAKKFKIMDDNDNGTLDINEFKKAMKECKISDISDRHAGRSDDPRRATTGDEIPAQFMQRLGELHDAGLVVHRQKSPHWTLPLSMISLMVRT